MRAPPRGFAHAEAGAWHPAGGLLGRLVRGRADRRQAETRHLLAALAAAVALALALQAAWALVGAAHPVPLLAVSAAACAAWAAVALVGRRPGVEVALRAGVLTARQGRAVVRVAAREVHAARRVTAEEAHRHWKRYAATRVFEARRHPGALVLRTAGGTPVLLALPNDALDRLEHALRAGGEPTRARAAEGAVGVEELA